MKPVSLGQCREVNDALLIAYYLKFVKGVSRKLKGQKWSHSRITLLFEEWRRENFLPLRERFWPLILH